MVHRHEPPRKLLTLPGANRGCESPFGGSGCLETLSPNTRRSGSAYPVVTCSPVSPDSDNLPAVPADLAAMRVGYAAQAMNSPAPESNLDVAALEDGWLPLLRRWLDQARSAGVVEPNAMVLATVDDGGSAGLAHGPVQGVVRGRAGLLHQLRLHQGQATRGRPVRLGDLRLDRVRTPGHGPRPGRTGRPRDHRRLLAHPPAGFAARRLGLAAVAADRVPERPRREARGGHRAVRRHGTGSGAAGLGRTPAPARDRRVLAGPRQPHAQPGARHPSGEGGWTATRLQP